VTTTFGAVEQPVQEGDGGGVLGQEPAPLVEWHDSQSLAVPSERRSCAAETNRNSSWAPVSSMGGEPEFVDQDEVVAQQGLDDPRRILRAARPSLREG
jgi:hypothetical protein